MSTLSEPTGDVTAQVRVTRLLGERRYAICLTRPARDAWVLDLDEARRLQGELAEAIAAADDLAGELPAGPGLHLAGGEEGGT